MAVSRSTKESTYRPLLYFFTFKEMKIVYNIRRMQGKIYKMTNSNGLIYIGSTGKTLKQRLCGHRHDYKRYLNGKCRHVTSFRLLEGDDDVKIELVETVDDCDKKALHERERYWIDYYKTKYGDKVVNKCIPNRTIKEYRKDNREKQLEQMKQYRKDNKDKLSQQHRCICGGTYTYFHKAEHMKTAKHKRFDNTLNYLKEVDPEFYDLILKDHGTTRNITIHIHL